MVNPGKISHVVDSPALVQRNLKCYHLKAPNMVYSKLSHILHTFSRRVSTSWGIFDRHPQRSHHAALRLFHLGAAGARALFDRIQAINSVRTRYLWVAEKTACYIACRGSLLPENNVGLRWHVADRHLNLRTDTQRSDTTILNTPNLFFGGRPRRSESTADRAIREVPQSLLLRLEVISSFGLLIFLSPEHLSGPATSQHLFTPFAQAGSCTQPQVKFTGSFNGSLRIGCVFKKPSTVCSFHLCQHIQSTKSVIFLGTYERGQSEQLLVQVLLHPPMRQITTQLDYFTSAGVRDNILSPYISVASIPSKISPNAPLENLYLLIL